MNLRVFSPETVPGTRDPASLGSSSLPIDADSSLVRDEIEQNRTSFFERFSKILSSSAFDLKGFQNLMAEAGMLPSSIEVPLEKTEGARLAAEDLAANLSFTYYSQREKALNLIENWRNCPERELHAAYNFALNHNKDPRVADALLDNFSQANSFIRAGSLARCLSGTTYRRALDQAKSSIQQAIWAAESKHPYTKLTFQHLVSPLILKDNKEPEIINLLSKALYINPVRLEDLFNGLTTSCGFSNSEMFLKLLARELTPQIAFDTALKAMLDPDIPKTVRRSLFVNFLIAKRDYELRLPGFNPESFKELYSILGFMRLETPRFIPFSAFRLLQACSVRLNREKNSSALKKIRTLLWDLPITIAKGPKSCREYLNQLHTVAAFLLKNTPSGNLFELITKGHDRQFFDRAKTVMAGKTGREEFFEISPPFQLPYYKETFEAEQPSAPPKS